MNLNLLAGMSYETICVIYAVSFFMVIVGKNSTKLIFCVIFSLLIGGLTAGFYLGTNGGLSLAMAFVISFFLNYFTSLIAFSICDNIDPESSYAYLFLWELFYNASYFLIIYFMNMLM